MTVTVGNTDGDVEGAFVTGEFVNGETVGATLGGLLDSGATVTAAMGVTDGDVEVPFVTGELVTGERLGATLGLLLDIGATVTATVGDTDGDVEGVSAIGVLDIGELVSKMVGAAEDTGVLLGAAVIGLLAVGTTDGVARMVGTSESGNDEGDTVGGAPVPGDIVAGNGAMLDIGATVTFLVGVLEGIVVGASNGGDGDCDADLIGDDDVGDVVGCSLEIGALVGKADGPKVFGATETGTVIVGDCDGRGVGGAEIGKDVTGVMEIGFGSEVMICEGMNVGVSEKGAMDKGVEVGEIVGGSESVGALVIGGSEKGASVDGARDPKKIGTLAGEYDEGYALIEGATVVGTEKGASDEGFVDTGVLVDGVAVMFDDGVAETGKNKNGELVGEPDDGTPNKEGDGLPITGPAVVGVGLAGDARTGAVVIVGLATIGTVVNGVSKNGAGEAVVSDLDGSLVGIDSTVGASGGILESGDDVVGSVISKGAVVPTEVITAVGELVSGTVPTNGEALGDASTGGMLGVISSETGGNDTGKTTEGAKVGTIIDGEATGRTNEGATVSGTPTKGGLVTGTALLLGK